MTKYFMIMLCFCWSICLWWVLVVSACLETLGISLFFSRMLACLPHRAETTAVGCGASNSIVFSATPVSFGLPGL